MKSVTGLEINNPNVCIKDKNSTFVCVCKECMELSLKKHNEYADKMREQQNTEPYNREALLDCLIDNKCDKLTARDLVVWGSTQYEKGQQSNTGV